MTARAGGDAVEMNARDRRNPIPVGWELPGMHKEKLVKLTNRFAIGTLIKTLKTP